MSHAEEAGLPYADAESRLSKPALALTILAVVLSLDMATKWWVVQNMALHQTIPVFGDVVRLTYTHNPGAAFGINIGDGSRVFFLVLSLIALAVLVTIYRGTPSHDRFRLVAVALIGSGAIGNIIDRIRYEAGVVDFLDIGIGAHRWWVFNVADSAVTIGAVLLLVSYFAEERRERAAARLEDGESGTGGAGTGGEGPQNADA